MKSYKLTTNKSRAQAMVEFAIALPILLMLLYGILETGRLLFLYSSVVTASRQAVRYGATTGVNDPTLGIPRYQDCAGIRLAAQRVDFLNAFDDEDILIQYDTGPGSTPTPYCSASLISDSSFIPSSANTNRLVITIDADFFPIIPKLVPFIERSVANGNPIQAESARTILVAVSIMVTAPPQPWEGTGGGALSLSISASPDTYSSAGQTIAYTYTLTNTGTLAVSGPFTIVSQLDDGTTVSVSCAATTLAPGESTTCTGSYQVTQADLNAGRTITNEATASAADGTISNMAIAVVSAAQTPGLALSKTASPTESSVIGTVITYTYTLTNTGNVTLNAPFAVSDNKLPSPGVSCPSGELAPGGVITCTASYSLKKSDVDQKLLINQATATARFGSKITVTSNQASATVYTGELILIVEAAPLSVNQPNQVITYTYRLKNNTLNNLSGPYTVTDSRIPSIDCSAATSPLAPGASTTCTASYVVTQGDLDTKTSLVNNVTARSATYTSNNASVSVVVAQNPALSMQLTGSPDVAMQLGDVITYTYTLTNSGNVTLSPAFTITDTKVSSVTCTEPSATLAPGATKTCTGTLTVSQADLDAGSITNQATASAKFGSQTVSSGQQSFTVITFVGARLRLQITPNPTTFTAAGQYILYTYTLTNTGTVPLNGPYRVYDDVVLSVDCPTGPLAVGASTTCAGSYLTTPDDVTAGIITNSAYAEASDGTQLINSNDAEATVTVPGTP